MSTEKRRNFKPEFKAKVAVEAVKEQMTIEEICKKFEVHPTQVNAWKKEFVSSSYLVFEKSEKVAGVDKGDKKTAELYAQIGQLKVENDFLKKKLK